MKRNRFLFYLIVSILVSMVDMMSDLGDEAIEEVIFFAVLTLPSVLGLCYVIFYLRKWVSNLALIERNTKQTSQKRLFWAIMIVLKTFVFSLVARYLSSVFFPEFSGGQFIDILFWGMFIGSLCVALFVYAFEAFIEVELEKQKFKLRLKEHENEKLIAKYLNLKKQLNPHFLFNSFNSLSGLIKIDAEKAEYFLGELSNVYRYTLEQSDEIVVTLEKELALIRSYVALQRIRFGQSLKVEYNISAEDLKKMVPPMTLELLIENAIKHNIVEKESPLEIFVRTLGNHVVISNNYQPRKNSESHWESTGMGLKNLINQYSLIHTEKPRFDIRNGKYVAVIPLIQQN